MQKRSLDRESSYKTVNKQNQVVWRHFRDCRCLALICASFALGAARKNNAGSGGLATESADFYTH